MKELQLHFPRSPRRPQVRRSQPRGWGRAGTKIIQEAPNGFTGTNGIYVPPPAPVLKLYVEKLKMLVLKMGLPRSSLIKLLVESSGWLEK